MIDSHLMVLGFDVLTKLLSRDIPAGVTWLIVLGSSWIFTVLFKSFGDVVDDVMFTLKLLTGSFSLLLTSDIV